MKRPKTIRVEVVVSVPRAGEFMVTQPIETSLLGDVDPSEWAHRLSYYAEGRVADMVRCTVRPAERARIRRALARKT